MFILLLFVYFAIFEIISESSSCMSILYPYRYHKKYSSNVVHFVATHLYRCGRNKWIDLLCCFAWFEYINKFWILYIPASTGKYIIIKTIFKTIKVIQLYNRCNFLCNFTNLLLSIRSWPMNLLISPILTTHW